MKTFFLIALPGFLSVLMLSCNEHELPQKKAQNLNLILKDTLILSLEDDYFQQIYLEGLCLQTDLQDAESYSKSGLFSVCSNSVIRESTSYKLDLMAYITTETGEITAQLILEAIPDENSSGIFLLKTRLSQNENNIVHSTDSYQDSRGNVQVSGKLMTMQNHQAVIESHIRVTFN